MATGSKYFYRSVHWKSRTLLANEYDKDKIENKKRQEFLEYPKAIHLLIQKAELC